MKYGLILFILFYFEYIQSSESNSQDNLFTKILESNVNLNTIISPLGIFQTLSILAEGASGQTRNEIIQALFPNKEINENQNFLNKINNNLRSISKGKFSNNLSGNDLVRKNDINLKIYGNKVKSPNLLFNNINVLFKDKKAQMTNEFSSICKNNNILLNILYDNKQINDYFYNETNEKLKEVLNEIKNNSEFLIINDNFFQGSWVNYFNREKTKKLAFENINHKIVEVETMNNIFNDVMYHEDTNFQMISLPFLTDNEKLKFKIIIFLPNRTKYTSPLNFLKQNNYNLNELISKLKLKKSVNLYLPKFDYEYVIPLKNILIEMDIKQVFSKEADFSKIFSNHSIKLHEIVHKTFIRINEDGVNIPSSTESNSINNSKNNYPETIYMNVNHSFIFAIVSNEIKDSKDNNNLHKDNINNVNIKIKENNISINNPLGTHKLKLNKILQKAYIRTKDNQNLTRINEKQINLLEDNNNTNASSSSNGSSIIKNNEIKISVLFMILMIIFI